MVVDDPSRFADQFSVSSPRLKNWDYSTPGIYFLTVCTLNNNNFFGKINNGKVCLSKIGEIAGQELLKTFEIRQNIKLLEYVIMPNHIHLLMEIINTTVETRCIASLPKHKKQSVFYKILNYKSNQVLPQTIRSFKSAVKRIANQQNLFFAWQSRFYDEIVKTSHQLFAIKYYIKNNPVNWEKDKFYQ
jgi:putative transposase